MIIVDTHLKKIPKTCTKCKYSTSYNTKRYCLISTKDKSPREVRLEWIASARNYSYIRPEWCPLKEV